MSNYIIIFNLSNQEYISIEVPYPEHDICRYNYAIVTFHTREGTIYTLLDEYMQGAIEEFNLILKRTDHHQLQLHESIKDDIGYELNEYINNEASHNFVEERGFWVGLRYEIWETGWPSNNTTWLYEKNNKFFFEITPNYPWYSIEPEPDEHYIPYDEFIKSYKPYVLREIPYATIQEWLAKTNELMRLIETNDCAKHKE